MGDAPALTRSFGQGGGQGSYNAQPVVVRTEGMITVRAARKRGRDVTSRGDIKLGTGATTVGGPAPGPSAN